MEHPLILITNDDGLCSPGLLAAVAAVQPLGDVLVVAPHQQQSSASRSMPASSTGRIFQETIEINGEDIPAYAVEGTPAQAVQHAILELTPRLPDLAVSGINYGENLGSSITTSGTLGAALEAAAFGTVALAASLGTEKRHHLSHSADVDFYVAAHFTAHFARLMLRRELPADVDILKLDVPAAATVETPWRLTFVSRQRYFNLIPTRSGLLSSTSPLDYEKNPDVNKSERGSDIYAFAVDHVVSVSPISLDLTSRVELSQLTEALSGGARSEDVPRANRNALN
jgi:5'-nucleotidase